MGAMKLGDDTKAELVKIGARLSLADGKQRSLEDVVRLLIDHWKKTKRE